MDHKPLESILRKSLLSVTGHFQRMMPCLQNFDFEVGYKESTLLHVADTLSRASMLKTQAKGAEADVSFVAYAKSPLEQEVEIINSLSFVPLLLGP